MGVKSFRPTTASRRHMTQADFSELTVKGRSKPEKSLTVNLHDRAGRSNQGPRRLEVGTDSRADGRAHREAAGDG